MSQDRLRRVGRKPLLCKLVLENTEAPGFPRID